MRSILFVLFFISLFLTKMVGAAAQSSIPSNCTALMASPVYVACYDQELRALADELSAMHRQAISRLRGDQRMKLSAEQASWETGLAQRCNMWTDFTSPGNALTARPCLEREYVARITKLGKDSSAPEDRLRDRPVASRGTSRRYFSIVATYDDPNDAIGELARLRVDFSYETFALYPPHGANSRWLVVFAAYLDHENARRAADLARGLAISSLPTVWSVPDTLLEDQGWKPCEISASSARVIVCDGHHYDGTVDKATASSILASRLNDKPAAITIASSYFTVVRSLKSHSEATRELNAQLSRFPTVQFALYPPYPPLSDADWRIMIASYTDQGQAEKAVELAKWLGIGTDVHLWQLPEPFKADKWEPEGLREIVVKCLTQGANSIMEMYACSGSVVTPALLQSCIKQGVCELGMTALVASAYLTSQGLDWNSALTLQTKLPDQQKLTGCMKSGDEKGYVDCALNLVTKDTPISACGTKTGDTELGDCILRIADLSGAQVDCLRKAKGRGDSILGCLNDLDDQGWAATRDCFNRHSDTIQATVSCLKPEDEGIPKLVNCLNKEADRLRCADLLSSSKDAVDLVRCLRSGATGALALLNCGGAVQANLDQAKIQCLRQLSTDTKDWKATCLPQGIAGPASCFVNYSGKTEELIGCVAQEKPELRQAITAVRCITNGRGVSDIIAVCAQSYIKDPKLRTAFACASQSNGSMNDFGGCVAGSFLGGEPGRLATCATQSASYAGFALCAAGPKMNQEWMIAAQCTASSGGVPVTAAACTAGWLTLNEFSKCFSKGIGGSGCFGNDNTIVLAVQNAYNDVTKGPGKNNEFVKGFRAVGIEFHDVSWSTPLGGDNAFLPKAGRDIGRAIHCIFGC